MALVWVAAACSSDPQSDPEALGLVVGELLYDGRADEATQYVRDPETQQLLISMVESMGERGSGVAVNDLHVIGTEPGEEAGRLVVLFGGEFCATDEEGSPTEDCLTITDGAETVGVFHVELESDSDGDWWWIG